MYIYILSCKYVYIYIYQYIIHTVPRPREVVVPQQRLVADRNPQQLGRVFSEFLEVIVGLTYIFWL